MNSFRLPDNGASTSAKVRLVLTRLSSSWYLGLYLLSLVIILWVASSFLVNKIFADDLYRKPFLITYINTGVFIFYLLPILFNRNGDRSISSVINKKKQLPLNETLKLSMNFCILWFLANLTMNASLSYTSVASQTILTSTSSFFTLLMGYVSRLETVNSTKVLALILSFTCIIIVTKVDSETEEDDISIKNNVSYKSVFGDFLALISTFIYSIYTILLKKKVKVESKLNMKLFLGFVGFFNLILLWPSILILNYFNLEKFEMPSNLFIWKILIVNCFISFIADFCWAKAILLTSPLTVTVGLTLTIPLAVIGDVIFNDKKISFIYGLCAVLICVAFIIINQSESDEEQIIESGEETEQLI
ncbi:DMT family transporter ASCRUDRAFT_129219 [Ascoidea rubescens DSM 1968]|uniref:Uncharacterized protein n=1 Tax=Ascoidea rubescens DSM 1968 TaxID=1344418 RepID=A0A1D2V953_9ASCO|nr:hypothetical protein ASCRUDRAFT_129219 [Ascoidea rubescens DSM 1968]ODV58047.1 hypothetical protein ASCRUDRAFT_129219 [Ascoidea rubescens DSM 1968]